MPGYSYPKGFPGDEDYEDEDYSATDELLGATVPAVSFPEIGTQVHGEIVKIDHGLQRDPNGEVRKFANGEPRKQAILTLQTAEKRDKEDDGRRRLFVKGTMVKTFREAIARAKVAGPRPGGMVTVAYVADGEPQGKGMNAPKLYSIEYKAPGK